jgi:hypothetical protein
MGEVKQGRNTPKSIGAIFAGLATVVLLSMAVDTVMHKTGIFPPMYHPMATSLWMLATAYRAVISVFGCYLAARLAPERPMKHAMFLGWFGVVISTLGTVLTWNKGPEFGPKWYPIALVVVALPCAWLGGRFASARGNRQAAGQAA